MEVKPDFPQPPEFVAAFWPTYKKRALILMLGVHAVLLLGGVVLFVLFAHALSLQAWIAVAAFALVTLLLVTVLTLAILRPLLDLSNALVHVSGERSNRTPPNLNDSYYERNNLRPLLKLIYELASGQPTATPEGESAPKVTPAVDLPGQLNNTATGIVMLDGKGTVVYANKSAPVHTESDGHQVLDLIFDVDISLKEWIAQRGDHDIHAERTWRRIADKLTGEDGRRLFDVFVSYQKGSEVETIVTLFDRTGEYQPEDDDLDFIAFAAHELRGPITVIRGYLDTLNDELIGVTQADQKELFQRLIVSANRLSGYVNNILNASRFDRRHLKVHLNELRIADIYETIADDMQLRATAQQRLLSVQFPDGLPTVAADLNSISEVMGNLIDNAIKYSNDGGAIEVSAAVNGDFVEVSVKDYGIGMPANVIQNLFHKFYRSHRSRETVAGTGIGLYISKAIVESNGGKISVQSVEGHGSTFTFSLPIYATVAEKLQTAGSNNQTFIEHSSNGWIKNHGAFRG